MSDKKEQQYCLTEIPDLGDISDFATDEAYDQEFWDKVAANMRKEHERYVKQCEAMCIDPESGKSTMSWEERNKMFNF